MRSPPPVLPPGKEDSPDYKRSWFDRAGPDAEIQLKAASYGAMVGALVFSVLLLVAAQGAKSPSFWYILGAGLFGIAVGMVVNFLTMRIAGAAGAIAREFTMPTGNSTPYEHQFSYQESLAARGDVAGALQLYEAIISAKPGAIAPRQLAAEHYARANRNPGRAAALFREIRDMPGVPARDAVYASSRLVDLYDGPLEEPGRALVELRRIIELYPNSTVARHGLAALPALKARLHGRSS